MITSQPFVSEANMVPVVTVLSLMSLIMLASFAIFGMALGSAVSKR